MTSQSTTDSAALTLHLLDELIGKSSAAHLAVRLWDGTLWPDDTPRPAVIVLKHPGALRQMFLGGTELGLAEAYLYDDFDIEGSLEEIIALAQELLTSNASLRKKVHLARELLHLPEGGPRFYGRRGPARLTGSAHSMERERQAVAYHYDISNEFYALFLDPRMIYSTARFDSPTASLAAAQEAMLEQICRKLQLQPGMRLLDTGCGWGGLMLYAAEKYGVDVTGITLSSEQARLAAERISAAGLGSRARVLLKDFRELETGEPYDALAAVGSFERVGEVLLPDTFEKAAHLLKPGGRLLAHGIHRSYTLDELNSSSFSNTYVYPDSRLETLSTVIQIAEETCFHVSAVENLDEQHLRTLRSWISSLEANHKEAVRFVDESTYRVWRLYLSGSAYSLAGGRRKVYQILLQKPGSGSCERREDWLG